MSERNLNAKFYDGQSPNPTLGQVRLEKGQLLFFDQDANSLTLAYDEIEEIQESDRETRLQIRRDLANSFHATLVIEGRQKGPIKQRIAASSTSLVAQTTSFVERIPFGGRIALGLALAILVLYFAFLGLDRAYHFVPQKMDEYLGDKLIDQVTAEYELCKHPKTQEAMGRMLELVQPKDSPYHYELILIDHKLINALALPGGKVMIFRGLWENAESPEEVLGVLAHEVGHVEERHGIRSMIKFLGAHFLIASIFGAGFEEIETIETLGELSSVLLFFKYSREFEAEADQKAVEYLHAEGVTVAGLERFFREMPHFHGDQDEKKTSAEGESAVKEKGKKTDEGEEEEEAITPSNESFLPSWLSTHPLPQDRAERLRQVLQKERVGFGKARLQGLDWQELKGLCQPETSPGPA